MDAAFGPETRRVGPMGKRGGYICTLRFGVMAGTVFSRLQGSGGREGGPGRRGGGSRPTRGAGPRNGEPVGGPRQVLREGEHRPRRVRRAFWQAGGRLSWGLEELGLDRERGRRAGAGDGRGVWVGPRPGTHHLQRTRSTGRRQGDARHQVTARSVCLVPAALHSNLQRRVYYHYCSADVETEIQRN